MHGAPPGTVTHTGSAMGTRTPSCTHLAEMLMVVVIGSSSPRLRLVTSAPPGTATRSSRLTGSQLFVFGTKSGENLLLSQGPATMQWPCHGKPQFGCIGARPNPQGPHGGIDACAQLLLHPDPLTSTAANCNRYWRPLWFTHCRLFVLRVQGLWHRATPPGLLAAPRTRMHTHRPPRVCTLAHPASLANSCSGAPRAGSSKCAVIRGSRRTCTSTRGRRGRRHPDPSASGWLSATIKSERPPPSHVVKISSSSCRHACTGAVAATSGLCTRISP